MVHLLSAFLWLASIGSLAHAGGVTTTIAPAEQCGNCLDDDGDGLTDFEDADCCETPPGTLTVEQLQIRPNDETSRMKLTASSLPAVRSLSPPTQILFLQLAPDDADPVFCAAVDAVHFRGKRDKATFTDRTNGVPSAGGVSAIRLQRLGTGSLRLTLQGTRLAFVTPAAGQLRIAVALRSLVKPGSPTRCVVRTVDVVRGKTSGLELP